MTIIEIPVKGSDEVVEVNLDELPDQPGDIMYILQEEEASRNLYLRFAVSLKRSDSLFYKRKQAEYYKIGNHDAFMELIKEGSLGILSISLIFSSLMNAGRFSQVCSS
jgi:hypothetical protein